MQGSNHSGEVRKRLLIDGERAVSILVVDVEINRISRDLILAQPVGNLEHALLRHITVAGLLESESPERRKRGRPGQPRIVFENVFGRGSIKKIDVCRPTLCAILECIGESFAKVEGTRPGVV